MPIKKVGLYFFLSILFFWAAYTPWSPLDNFRNKLETASFQETFIQQEKRLKESIEKIVEVDQHGALSIESDELIALKNEEDISLFIYHEKKLFYWSDDLISFSEDQVFSDALILKLGNGWYYKLAIEIEGSAYVGLLLIKHTYPYQNQYLRDELQKSFRNQRIKELTISAKSEHAIFNADKKYLFSLHFNENESQANWMIYLQLLSLLFASSIFALKVIPLLFLKKSSRVFSVALFFVFLRLTFKYFLPEAISALVIFQPYQYASSFWSPSLGDFLLNTMLGFALAYQLLLWAAISSKKWQTFMLILLSSLSGIWIIDQIQSSINNSAISFNLTNLLELSVYSGLIFLAFIACFYTVIVLWKSSLISARNSGFSSEKIWYPIGIQLIIIALAWILFGAQLFYLWAIIPLILLYQEGNFKSRTINILLLLIYLSSVTAFLVDRSRVEKERANRKIIVQKLAEEKDPVAEYLFTDLSKAIISDSLLKTKNFLDQKEKQETANYIKSTYFNSYWKKYKPFFTFCSAQDSIFFEQESQAYSCYEYFFQRIKAEGLKTSHKDLFQLKNLAGRIDYLARIPIDIGSQRVFLFLELSSSLFNQNEGYPELLLDQKSQWNLVNLNDYSLAVYDKNLLAINSGKFNYSTYPKISELGMGSYYQYSAEEFEHLAYQKDEDTTIIISKRAYTVFDFFTSLAYLLVLFAFLYVVLSSVLKSFPFRFHWFINDFSSRLQFYLVSSLFLALLFFGMGTGYYIKKQNEEKNDKNISEKMRSIYIELQNKIGGEGMLQQELKPFISATLIKLSNVFYTDLNLYGVDGILYASSRPEIFEQGLKSSLIHPLAYKGLVNDQKAEWIQQEKIGELNYLSAYIPFKNNQNKVLAYLNLPYFAKQGELQAEISSFFVSTINIYVGIFVLALLLSLLLVNQLSRPLLLIRTQLSKLKLGGDVDLIKWNSKDEIGLLVNEYNKMVVQLSESAEQLAKSEREDAWREMAKQVAHEIKNPLTPMKLSIQHLQRVGDSTPEEIQERINKTAQTLIEQIDTLSNIATEFSHFAKMPEKSFQKVDLIGIISIANDLYSNEVNLLVKNEQHILRANTFADHDQLIRLFNNLIKNAIQAKREEVDGQIEIAIEELENFYLVAIKDNGIGIPKEQFHKIFEPNFTTKSSGTGLGLAMSKSIMDNLKGSIEFESSLEIGTTFYLRFPKA